MSAGIFIDDGQKLRGITVDRDDSPGFVGAILYAKYQTIKRVESLLKLGDLVELHETLKPSPSIGHYILLENDVVKEIRLQEGVCVSKSRDIRTLEGNIIKKSSKVKERVYESQDVFLPFVNEGLNFMYVFNEKKCQWKTYGIKQQGFRVEELQVHYLMYIKNLIYRDDITELSAEEKANLEYVK